jgi:hypothetical protein
MWQYHDYGTLTDPVAKLARLKLHIAEVRLKIGPAVSSDGQARSSDTVLNYLNGLVAEEKALEAVAGSTGGAVSRARFVKAR